MSFINNGLLTHTVVAQDASWTTGPLTLGESGCVKLDKLGTRAYACKEHPWAMGELTVE